MEPLAGTETKIYFGCDSERVKMQGKWYADYMTVIVVHINGRSGCKIFAEISREQDYDKKASSPFTRMMTEARKVSDLHARFKDVFDEFEIYIHLDVNPKKTAGSSVAAEAAAGYVKAMTNVTPLLKPMAFAASYAADRSKDILGLTA
jgi:predicted RNase H-related nuclease YkuK (DUF458 family)